MQGHGCTGCYCVYYNILCCCDTQNSCLSVIRLAHHTSRLLMVEMREMGIFCIINLRDRAVMKFWIAVACGAYRTWDFHNGCSCKIHGGSNHRTDSLYRLSSLNLWSQMSRYRLNARLKTLTNKILSVSELLHFPLGSMWIKTIDTFSYAKSIHNW